MTQNASTFDEIRFAFDADGSRKAGLERIAEAIRAAGRYRWVGIYEVMGGEIAAIAWSGPGPPGPSSLSSHAGSLRRRRSPRPDGPRP